LQETSSSPSNSSVEISKKNNVSDIGTRGLVNTYVIDGDDFCHTMQSQQQLARHIIIQL
jgi:hypothetical protein